MPQVTKNTLELKVFLNEVNQLRKKAVPHLEKQPVKLQGSGRKYLRLATHDENGKPESVFCFINTSNGDVLKAASWRLPAKHARGNIFDEDGGLNGMSWTGPRYLR